MTETVTHNGVPHDDSKTTDDEADRRLRIYLQDHFAGSSAGLALVQRCRRANPELDNLLGALEREIAEDRQSLEAIMSRLGVQPNPIKSALGTVSEFVGRLKSNGTISGYSPSSRVVELEGLAAGVFTKRNLWRSLLAVADLREGLDRTELEELVTRATSQFERILDAHGAAAARAFGR